MLETKIEPRQELELIRLLLNLGVDDKQGGYNYIKRGIALMLSDKAYETWIELRDEISYVYGKTPYGVEQCMNWTLDKAYKSGLLHNFDKIIGEKVIFNDINIMSFITIASEYLKNFK